MMRRMASQLATDPNGNSILRSGHANGADLAFEEGAEGKAQIFLPWSGFNADYPLITTETFSSPTDEAYEIAARFHPAWDQLKQGARKLHARNSHIMLGPNLDEPVSVVICWTPDAKPVGGTSQALRIADCYEIPVLNLADPIYRKNTETLLKTC
jgi:hypothetical protein